MDGYNDDLDRPLFGVSTRRERLINLVIGVTTSIFVAVTIVTSIIPKGASEHNVDPKNIFFAVCIAVVCASLLIMIHWYRQGDVDPKFKKLIYFNAASIVLLCACANFYFFSDQKASAAAVS